eukprot:11166807-Lingulodinium_polyedra.AAC.1
MLHRVRLTAPPWAKRGQQENSGCHGAHPSTTQTDGTTNKPPGCNGQCRRQRRCVSACMSDCSHSGRDGTL